ncbi:MAG: carboxypeptidase-like regulatory domain-containing protein, partial [Solirubrobacteraceae bacterium]|nr:carboxypeptidase-like regulatory domain-containing protein [Solirubrobacteraceae bacterium]
TNGSLSVNVDRADGKTGVSGLSVTIEPKFPGTSYTDSTNENGCVVFPFVAAGQYTLSFNRIGYVDQDSRANIEDTVSVPAGATNKVGYLYDLAGTTATRFTTKTAELQLLGQTLVSSTVKSYPKELALYSPDQSSGPIVETVNGPNPGGTDVWDTRKPLFPSEAAYTLYAGACQDNRPPSGSNLVNVNITAGAFQNAATVKLPAYDIRVTDGQTSLLPGNPIAAKVSFYAGCGATYFDTTQSLGSLNLRSGRLADPGFPYTLKGTLCVSAVINGTRWTFRDANVVNKEFDNPQVRPIILRKDGTANGTDCTA